MTDSQAEQKPAAEIERDATGRRIFTCGTLKYTVLGLCSLFFWLLWGDFVWVLLNTAIPGILPLKLKEMGASDTQMSLLVKTLGTTIVCVLNPLVSFKSDRYRSRWGRRIPFLMWSTPVVGLFMVLMGCFEDVTQWFVGDSQQVVFLGFALSRMAVSLIIFAVLLVGFDVVDIYNDTIYYYLFNDVVPPKFLARFLALFRMVGTGASMLYNAFFMEHALTSFRLMWVAGGIAYTIGYLLMCFFVKEGQYPPPPENVDKRSGLASAMKTYAKECFTHRFYWYFFLMNTFFAVSWAASSVFAVLRNTGSLELSLKDLGRMSVYLGPISLGLMYPAAWLADRLNPVRVYFVVTFICVLSNAMQAIFIFTDFGPSVNLLLMYAISLLFMPFSALQGAAELPMYMRLLPKERYGQFCSANGMVRSFANIFASAIVGVVFGWMGARPASGYKVATSVIDVTGTRAETTAWKEEAVGPWKVDYRDHDDRTGRVVVPGATAVRLVFGAIRTEHGADHLTTDTAPPDDWSGSFDQALSGVQAGDSIGLRLRSSMATPGSFTVTKVLYQGVRTGAVTRIGMLWETDGSAFSLAGRVENGKSGVPGVTIAFAAAQGGAAPAPVLTDGSGNWAQYGFATGRAYRVSAAKTVSDGTWTFTPPTNVFAAAVKDAKIASAWTEGAGWTEEPVGPWVAKYQNLWDRAGTITVPGATAVKVFFEVLKTEAGVDFLSTDGEHAVPRSGNTRGWSEVKAGNTLTLRLISGLYGKLSSNMTPRRSGSLYNDYEIRVTKVAYQGAKTGDVACAGALWNNSRKETFPLSGQVKDAAGRGVPGVVVSFRTLDGAGAAPAPALTDARGNWCQTGFGRGSRYLLSAAKNEIGATWTFSAPTVGDWRYRYYPLWAMFFHVFALTCLVLLYRGWKARGGDQGYIPPEA
jgi:Na+/melibiose symporter-like transporter